MIRILSLAALMMASAVGFQSFAGELDNEKAVTNEQVQAAKDLPATLVIRVNEQTKAVEVLHSKEKLAADQTQAAALSKAAFKKMDVKSGMTGELDRDSSKSSWYFCWPSYNWYYPAYYYYGYTYSYSSYYYYNYGGYGYYYYGWRW
jgi:hypothetical protein